MLRTCLALVCAALAAAPAPPQGAPIRVHVVDRTGAAVAGAKVATFDDSHPGTVVTGADGWCALDLRAERGPAFRMRVEADGYFHSEALQARVTEIAVELFRSLPMSGRVVARDTRQPLAGATVEFVHPLCRKCAPDRIACDAEGRFRAPSVPVDAQATFFAVADGYAKQAFTLGFADPMPAHELELARGVEIRGRVIDSATRAPVAAARVATRGKVEAELPCDAEGRFAMRVLPDANKGRVNMEAFGEGYCKLRFLVRNEGASELELPLFRPAFIEGVVVDAQGTPLSGAEVAVRESNDWLEKRRAHPPVDGAPIPFDALPADWFVTSGHPNHTVLADAQGRFRTQGVVPWSPKVLLQVEHANVQRFTFEVGPVGEPGSTLTVRGAPPLAVSGPRIRGKVRVNDEPVFGAVAWKGATRSGQAVLDAQGTFEARNVELGDVELQAVKLQTRKVVYGSLFDGDVARVTVAEDADAQHDFDLKSEMVRMEGRVQTASGKPCAKTTVSVGERERDTKASAVTDEQGAFSLSLPKLAGPWRAVAAWGPELFEKSVEAPGAALVLEVPDLGRGLARFVDRRTRAEIIPASVSWRRAGETRFQLRDLTFDAPVEDERWYPFQIPYGEFELVAWTPRPGYAPAPLSKLAWKEGDPEPRMVFELEQGIAVDFALASDSAAPSSDDRERVWLLEASPAFFGDVGPPWTREDVQLPTYADRTRRVSFDAQGRARIAGLRTGKHRFVSFSPSLRVEPAEIEITAENQRFEVRIVRAP